MQDDLRPGSQTTSAPEQTSEVKSSVHSPQISAPAEVCTAAITAANFRADLAGSFGESDNISAGANF